MKRRHIVLDRRFFEQKKDLMAVARQVCWMILFVLLGVGCHQAQPQVEEIDIKSYYFPIHKLDGGMMFVYKYKDARMPEFYRHLKTKKQQDSLYLKVIELNGDFLVEQKFTEQIYPSGTRIINYQIMDIDSLGQIDTATLEIQNGDSYPFYVEKDGGVYIFQTKWIFSKNPESKYELIRNRRYVGDTTFVFKGKEVPAIMFSVKELIVNDLNGRQELEFNKTEIYAKGLGLVYSKNPLNDSLSLEYQLADTLAGSLLLE